MEIDLPKLLELIRPKMTDLSVLYANVAEIGLFIHSVENIY